MVVDKRTSGCRSITSSIYLNWNISIICCRIEIKLASVKAEWQGLLFHKNYFLKSLPVSQTWRHLAFNCGYLSYFTFDRVTIWSQESGSPLCHIKYYVTWKVTLTFGVNAKVNAYSFLSLGLSVHNTVNFWPNYSNLSTAVVDKGTSGCRGITSSLYLNWNISIIYCRIEIKLVLGKAKWRWLFFVKNTFYVTSGLANMTSWSFQLRIYLLLYVGLSHKLVREILIVHITCRSYKYHLTLKVTLTFGINCKVNEYSFFFVWFFLS